MLLMGLFSVLAMKRDAPSLKTFNLAAAVVVGLLSWSFVTQVRFITAPWAFSRRRPSELLLCLK